MKAWYFSNSDCRLGYGDGRQIKAGVTHSVNRAPVLCRYGLHGSVNILDALRYAPGPYVWRVNLSGNMDIGSDKIAATSRTYLWGMDATNVMKKFSRLCALDVVHLWDAPDAVIRYLKTGDDSIKDAAWDAARNAAWAAAWDAALAAARNAARNAAWDAARDAAWDVAWAAALAAGRDVAWDVAWKRLSSRLYRMIMRGRS